MPPGVDCQGIDDVLLGGNAEHLERSMVGLRNSAVIVIGDQRAREDVESGNRRQAEAVGHDRAPDLGVGHVKRLIKGHRTLQA
jgi:hypothetical protein